MNKTKDIINGIMLRHGMKRKRDVAHFFGVSPQALSLWIAKNQIPPKHLLKLTERESMDKTTGFSKKTHKNFEEKKN